MRTRKDKKVKKKVLFRVFVQNSIPETDTLIGKYALK